ncbi:MAG: hypothetical protein ACI4S9_04100 [Christensenellales bacterium]
MDVVLIIFMIIACTVSIFSLAVIVTDLIKERKSKSQAKSDSGSNVVTDNTAITVSESKTEPAEIEVAQTDQTNDVPVEGNVVFSAGEKKTLDVKFQELDSELQKLYVEIVQYAMTKPDVRQYKNDRYEEYRIGKNRIVRMQIKRGAIFCEFLLLNSDFRNFISDNKVHVRQEPTVLRVENAQSVVAAKNGIDIAVKAAADEIEYKKQKRREKRRLYRQRLTEEQAESVEAESVDDIKDERIA